jgi:4-aminobutyrate--pyruvate transaminase
MTVMPNSLAARDIAYHLHPYTNAVKHEAEGPLVISHGKGIYIYDENGKEYIDRWPACVPRSDSRRALVEAAARQMRKLRLSLLRPASDIIELAGGW